MKLKLICSIILLSLILSCKKDENHTIHFYGTMRNTDNSIAAGVTMKISYQEVGNASYSTAYKTAGSVTSASDGSYSISFDAPRATSYKFLLTSPLHFTKEIIENAETVQGENLRDLEIEAKSWFRIRIHNASPQGNPDQIIFQNLSEAYGCAECCNNSVKVFNGMNVDTTLICIKAGGEKIKFQWTVTKASITQTFKDSITTIPYDTLDYDLGY